jgi:hypothetical protein
MDEDNDALAVWLPTHSRTDDNYTQGLRAQFEINPPSWANQLSSNSPLCRLDLDPGATCRTASLHVGQQLFTPSSLADPPPANERPYAAWLYIGLAEHASKPHELRMLGVDFGVTGPPALGGPEQNAFHKLADVGAPRAGWSYQIGFQPGIILSYETRYLLPVGSSELVQVTPRWSVYAGNIQTGLVGGLTVRLGYHMVHPWRPLDDEAHPWSVYALLDGEGRSVAVNLLLDGAGSSDPHVRKLPFTSRYSVGVGMRIRGLFFEFRGVTQGQEYAGGPRAHRWGTFSTGVGMPL